MKRYDPHTIEPKWQKVWQDTDIYRATEAKGKQHDYVLDFFPYPSGAAMHVGHVRNYTISDAMARFSRMQGKMVLHPMGWDAFGLPAENYAIKTGISPKEAVAQNTTRFKKQLMQMGVGIDWSREFSSTDPAYYRWTQWFFKLLFDRGLAYQKESLQWWCDTDKTVLANEQVEAGRCWRCGNEVTKKPLKQWFFKITDYADRLLADLDDLDWSDAIKTMQRNWIGRSKGAEVHFAVEDSHETLRVFTTRPDTLYGATFMVIAPEHPQLASLTTAEHKAAVEGYVESIKHKSDIDRMETGRAKTGRFTGSYVLNPLNGKRMPIWVADYVLMGYGTGAIMAVPAHDERDYDFAVKYLLDIVTVIEPETGEPQPDPEFRQSIVAVVRDPKTNKYLSINWGKLGGNLFVGGGLEAGEEPSKAAIREIHEETGYKHLKLVTIHPSLLHHNYFAHSKGIARRIEAQALLFELIDDEQDEPKPEVNERGKFTVEWLSEKEVASKITDALHATSYELLVKNSCYAGEGVMVNSGPYTGMPSTEVRDRIVADLSKNGTAKERVNYKLRDWLISRQRYWGAPIPIIHCEACGPVAVPEEQLPVELPDIDDYKPAEDGRSPLARVPEWVNTICPTCKGPAKRETDTMDGFACSSWYFLRFADPHNDQKPFDIEKVKYWLPVNTYIGGAEHAVMHLLYARFWTKVMFDAQLIDFKEPFSALRNQGMILAPDGRKMSKSWGNVIAPDDLISEGYGADSIRLMELFIGPWNQSANWSTEGLGGCYRFLQRVWTLAQEYLEYDKGQANSELEVRLLRATHRTVKRITADLTAMGFNTAIAALMEFVNELYKIKTELVPSRHNEAWHEAMTALTQLLAPFAPHLSEELWQQLGNDQTVHLSAWPTWDEAYLVEETMTIVVQVNGKVRSTLLLPADSDEAIVRAEALKDERIKELVGGQSIRRTIYISGKLINLVV